MNLIISEERRLILEIDRHALVIGGPGSGKTTLALLKAKRRIEDGLAAGQSVLFLSFSRAAVARVIQASKTQVPRELQAKLAIQTFHSFFWQIVRTHGYLLGAPRKLRLLLPHDEKALRLGEQEDNADWQAERERLFREEGRVVFDLFAPKASALLRSSKRIRSLIADCHPLIVVDEAQDTADDQWACAKALAEKSQLLCLADLEQQIYDFLPGVSARRVAEIMSTLDPVQVDLGTENHRSPHVEIIKFGNDVRLNTPRGAPYKGVSRRGFRPDSSHRDAAIRSSIGILRKTIEQAIGRKAESIAILATWGRGVAIISHALRGNGGRGLIPHQVLLDEASVLLSSRLVAFLLEPKEPGSEMLDLANALDLAAAVFRAKGKATNIELAQRLAYQGDCARRGGMPSRAKEAGRLLAIIKGLQAHSFCGEPKTDWLYARGLLKGSNLKALVAVAVYAEQLMAFNRGERISTGLTDAWQLHGRYEGARTILDAAIAQDQLLSGTSQLSGISVMTIHKSKGKEFDGVMIVDESRSCPLVFCREPAPYRRSRTLLRVGITRARHHVLLLTDLYNLSAILEGHRL